MVRERLPRYPRAVRTAGTFVARSTLVAGLCLALLALAPTVATAAPKRGIDVSRFQGEIKWQRVGQTNVEFAWVQASRGEGDDCAVVPDRCGADEFYADNYAGASAAGIRVGAYHRTFAGGGGRRRSATPAGRRRCSSARWGSCAKGISSPRSTSRRRSAG